MQLLTEDRKNTIEFYLRQGFSYHEIAKIVKVSSSTVHKIRLELGLPARIDKGGRPKALTKRGQQHLVRAVTVDDLENAVQAQQSLEQNLGKSVSVDTVRRALRDAGLVSFVRPKKPLINERNRKRRLQWDRQHIDWTVNDWMNVIWSDETKINRFGSDGKSYAWKVPGQPLKKHQVRSESKTLAWAEEHKNWTSDDWRRMVFSDEKKVNVYGSDGCKYYWSRPDDKLQPYHLDLTVKGGDGSIMVWGCITYDGPGYACWISEDTMKASDYVGILGTTLMDSVEYYGYRPQDIYFQQDNDLKHTSKLARQWFKENKFKCDHTFNWPSQSPDLSPIEHIWHHLKLKLSAYDTRAKGVHELWNRVEKEWSTFTAEDSRRYIDSMPDRCRAVIAAKCGHTRY
ncbi:hypothetical protein G6F43_011430 [Rhizopus delemar]|nr:hypothetical protein G6F43_011430 [Rhizopus delemar]